MMIRSHSSRVFSELGDKLKMQCPDDGVRRGEGGDSSGKHVRIMKIPLHRTFT